LTLDSGSSQGVCSLVRRVITMTTHVAECHPRGVAISFFASLPTQLVDLGACCRNFPIVTLPTLVEPADRVLAVSGDLQRKTIGRVADGLEDRPELHPVVRRVRLTPRQLEDNLILITENSGPAARTGVARTGPIGVDQKGVLRGSGGAPCERLLDDPMASEGGRAARAGNGIT
jgi:hypothetical protein